MIPSKSIEILGRQQAHVEFDLDADYVLTGRQLMELEALMRRLFIEQRMLGDEMRDWASLLHNHLTSAVKI